MNNKHLEATSYKIYIFPMDQLRVCKHMHYDINDSLCLNSFYNKRR